MKKRMAVLLMASGVLVFTGCEKVRTAGAQAGPAAAGDAASGVVELDDTSFAAQTARGVALVDFWAPWCGPCRTQGPIVEQAAAKLGGKVMVAKVNVDQAAQTARKFGVSSIPTLIVFKDGKTVKQFVGVTQADELVAAVRAAEQSK